MSFLGSDLKINHAALSCSLNIWWVLTGLTGIVHAFLEINRYCRSWLDGAQQGILFE